MNTRVRFAPSPTGPLHMGGVRTALFNYLFARKNNGTMILRIEDTDQNRYVPGAEEYIMESLDWCGIKIDEGVREGGDYGPYRQSDRKDIYRQYADRLIASGWAYYAFDSAEELEGSRLKAQGSGSFAYDSSTRMELKNSLSLPKEKVKSMIESGEPYVIRFKFPENEDIVMQDLIRGEVVVNTASIDDKVLFKSDGMPTYHLANVVDDYLMKISHVIRGEEWLPSLPLHVMLYRAFGWKDVMPQFAHLPLILKPAGNGKLSKRDGDKLGFPVFPIEYKNPDTGEVSSGYRESGYLPEAFINILALLGWNPGTEQEVFSMDELCDAFSLDRVGKSGSRFDPEKAKNLNHQYIQSADNERVLRLIEEGDSGGIQGEFKGIQGGFEGNSGGFRGIQGEFKGIQGGFKGKDEVFLGKVLGLVKERMNLLTDFWEHAHFFFEAPVEYDEKMAKKGWKEGTGEIMKRVIRGIQGEFKGIQGDSRGIQGDSRGIQGDSRGIQGKFKGIQGDSRGIQGEFKGIQGEFSSVILENNIKAWIEEEGLGMGQVMNPLRLALVGAPKGPGIFDIMEVLGKEETIRRIQKAIDRLG